MNAELKLVLYLAGTIAGLVLLAQVAGRALPASKQGPRLLVTPILGREM